MVRLTPVRHSLLKIEKKEKKDMFITLKESSGKMNIINMANITRIYEADGGVVVVLADGTSLHISFTMAQTLYSKIGKSL